MGERFLQEDPLPVGFEAEVPIGLPLSVRLAGRVGVGRPFAKEVGPRPN